MPSLIWQFGGSQRVLVRRKMPKDMAFRGEKALMLSHLQGHMRDMIKHPAFIKTLAASVSQLVQKDIHLASEVKVELEKGLYDARMDLNDLNMEIVQAKAKYQEVDVLNLMLRVLRRIEEDGMDVRRGMLESLGRKSGALQSAIVCGAAGEDTKLW